MKPILFQYSYAEIKFAYWLKEPNDLDQLIRAMFKFVDGIGSSM